MTVGGESLKVLDISANPMDQSGRGRMLDRSAMGMEYCPDPLEISRVYDSVPDSFFRERNNPNGLFNTFLWPVYSRYLGDVSGLNVLDVGCGPGVVSNRLALSGAKVVGIDNSTQMIKIARANYGNHVEFFEEDVQKLPFADESLDLVTDSYVFNHLDKKSLEGALAEIHRVLKKGGKLVMMEPHPFRNQLYYEANGGKGPFPEGWYRELFPELQGVSVPVFFRRMDTWTKAFKKSPFDSDFYIFSPTSQNSFLSGASKKAKEHYSTNRVFIAGLEK